MKNLGTSDRLLRVIVAELCILIAFFWAAEEWQIPLYLIAAIMLLQAATRTCGLYTLLGWNSCEIVKRKGRNVTAIFVVTALSLAVVGSYTSAILTKSIFLEDAKAANESLTLALQYSGNGNRENAMEQFIKLESASESFQEKYSKYKPLTVKFDGNFTAQMNNISAAISGSRQDFFKGNLSRGHEELIKARPFIQKMLKR
jgi:hypothetical protein